ncbi:hypothetical protein [Dyadobacter sp. 32]|uniref:hypothetical protein n=1 Tax=Dyadobacter sp. 32 TaxID=538966 RepID=UPI0011EBB5E7
MVDRKLIAKSLLTILTASLQVYIIMKAETIHLPYLVAVISAMVLGYTEPRRGWLLALLQCFFVVLGHSLLKYSDSPGVRTELENFMLYGSIILTFAASFIGAFLKRALKS